MSEFNSQSDEKKSRTGLNLLGGGITGAFFHFGVMAALDDHLSRKSTQHDVYAGTSAGSLVSAVVAMGLKPQLVLESILKDDGEIFVIERRDIYRFSIADIGKEIFKFLWTLFYLTYLKIENPSEAPSYFWGLKDSLPAGLFSMRYYEDWIHQILIKNNLPLFFPQIPHQVFIPAYDLDSCKRVVFGRPGFRHIPISKCIAASSAIPMFFQPVEIEGRSYVDGGIGDIAHLDLVASAGANLMIVVNPMVPIQNDHELVKIKTVYEEKGRIRDKGLTYIFDQTLRNELRLRVHAAINYMGYLYPSVDLLLIEPDETDPTMFLINPMDFEARRQIVEYAYNLTRRKLRENSELWKRTLDRHEITLVGV